MSGTASLPTIWHVVISIPGLDLHRYVASETEPTHDEIAEIWSRESDQVLRPRGWRGPLADAYPGVGLIERIEVYRPVYASEPSSLPADPSHGPRPLDDNP